MWTLIIFAIGPPLLYPIWMPTRIASIGGFTTEIACLRRAEEIERTTPAGISAQCIRGARYD
jgi:hypothetical protein